jgi:hypothetical protein
MVYNCAVLCLLSYDAFLFCITPGDVAVAKRNLEIWESSLILCSHMELILPAAMSLSLVLIVRRNTFFSSSFAHCSTNTP